MGQEVLEVCGGRKHCARIVLGKDGGRQNGLGKRSRGAGSIKDAEGEPYVVMK